MEQGIQNSAMTEPSPGCRERQITREREPIAGAHAGVV